MHSFLIRIEGGLKEPEERFRRGLKKAEEINFAKKVAQKEKILTFARAFEKGAKRDREVHCNRKDKQEEKKPKI